MSEQNYREIQLSGKQLVFLFMTIVVLGVAVFLLGVSVGRGVKGGLGSGSVMAADSATAPESQSALAEPALPPTTLGPGDLGYSNVLQSGSAASGGARPDAPPAAMPAAEPPPVDEPAPATGTGAKTGGSAAIVAAPAPEKKITPPDVKTPAVSPARPTADASAAAKPQAGQGWSLQVDAFKSRDNAERQVAKIKRGGTAAYIVSAPPLFHVRVGPFSQRAEADRTAARLRQQGFKPSVIR